MGDRANVLISGVYLYTHWGGRHLPFIVRDALKKKWRWDDDAYLTRIVFCEMVKGQEAEETGFGICSYMPDNEHPVIELNCDNQTITIGSVTKTFEEYAAMDDGELQEFLYGGVNW